MRATWALAAVREEIVYPPGHEDDVAIGGIGRAIEVEVVAVAGVAVTVGDERFHGPKPNELVHVEQRIEGLAHRIAIEFERGLQPLDFRTVRNRRVGLLLKRRRSSHLGNR